MNSTVRPYTGGWYRIRQTSFHVLRNLNMLLYKLNNDILVPVLLQDINASLVVDWKIYGWHSLRVLSYPLHSTRILGLSANCPCRCLSIIPERLSNKQRSIRCLLKSFKLNFYKKSMTNPKYLCNSRPGILQRLTLQIVQRRLQSKTGQLPGRLLHISVSDIASRRHLRTVSRHHLTVGLPLYRLSTFGLLCHRSGTLYRTVSHSRRSAAAAAASCNY